MEVIGMTSDTVPPVMRMGTGTVAMVVGTVARVTPAVRIAAASRYHPIPPTRVGARTVAIMMAIPATMAIVATVTIPHKLPPATSDGHLQHQPQQIATHMPVATHKERRTRRLSGKVQIIVNLILP